ncbi:hypothetical protein PIB30_050608 [Stylosanthes scabra]|uniref:Uncharacterized protein n=1 Tax=Stylosanthes scabra TaxID=79078 RepID=A0ABU6XFD6_9FABA|nr:hypothetical protein [Stylosanthes scabra]
MRCPTPGVVQVQPSSSVVYSPSSIHLPVFLLSRRRLVSLCYSSFCRRLSVEFIKSSSPLMNSRPKVEEKNPMEAKKNKKSKEIGQKSQGAQSALIARPHAPDDTSAPPFLNDLGGASAPPHFLLPKTALVARSHDEGGAPAP